MYRNRKNISSHKWLNKTLVVSSPTKVGSGNVDIPSGGFSGGLSAAEREILGWNSAEVKVKNIIKKPPKGQIHRIKLM